MLVRGATLRGHFARARDRGPDGGAKCTPLSPSGGCKVELCGEHLTLQQRATIRGGVARRRRQRRVLANTEKHHIHHRSARKAATRTVLTYNHIAAMRTRVTPNGRARIERHSPREPIFCSTALQTLAAHRGVNIAALVSALPPRRGKRRPSPVPIACTCHPALWNRTSGRSCRQARSRLYAGRGKPQGGAVHKPAPSTPVSPHNDDSAHDTHTDIGRYRGNPSNQASQHRPAPMPSAARRLQTTTSAQIPAHVRPRASGSP